MIHWRLKCLMTISWKNRREQQQQQQWMNDWLIDIETRRIIKSKTIEEYFHNWNIYHMILRFHKDLLSILCTVIEYTHTYTHTQIHTFYNPIHYQDHLWCMIDVSFCFSFLFYMILELIVLFDRFLYLFRHMYHYWSVFFLLLFLLLLLNKSILPGYYWLDNHIKSLKRYFYFYIYNDNNHFQWLNNLTFSILIYL